MTMKRIFSGVLALGAALSFPSAQAQEQPAAPAAKAEAQPAAAPAAAVAEAPLPDLSSDAIAARVQAFYDGAKTFQAAFNQRYTIYAYNKKKESHGRVAFVKPGKMSWR